LEREENKRAMEREEEGGVVVEARV